MADAAFESVQAGAGLTTIDRAFALELFAGVLRNLTLLDFWIARLRRGRTEAAVADLLRLGLYQLLIADVASHAAVFETVALAPAKARGVVNAVVRTADRERDRLKSEADSQPLPTRTSHPEFLVSRWQANFGDEATAQLCAWNNEPPPVYGRVNGLAMSREQFLQQYPEAGAVPRISQFVQFSAFPTAALKAGHCYIQDPSTRLATAILEPARGETILDACAAPGGKTSHIAELMNNEGVIIACDRQSDRLGIVRENMERLGAAIVRPLQHDWICSPLPSELRTTRFDRILVDAPCSNTGVMRRRVDLRWRLQPGAFSRMQSQQLAILRSVIPLLKIGGALVYSTCSLEPEENETIVTQLQAEFGDVSLEQTRTSVPFRDHFDGAFVARLRRNA
jgi:16S rRNA (cytosine967-C5)-methyltransferase